MLTSVRLQGFKSFTDATVKLNPIKTLEYMAGEKPVVSTPVGDVIALYGDCVTIATAGQPFVDACEQALEETDALREQRVAKMLWTVQQSSWDRSAAKAHALIESVLSDQRTVAMSSKFPVPLDLAGAVPYAQPSRVAAAG